MASERNNLRAISLLLMPAAIISSTSTSRQLSTPRLVADSSAEEGDCQSTSSLQAPRSSSTKLAGRLPGVASAALSGEARTQGSSTKGCTSRSTPASASACCICATASVSHCPTHSACASRMRNVSARIRRRSCSAWSSNFFSSPAALPSPSVIRQRSLPICGVSTSLAKVLRNCALPHLA
ncbi:hypothetical protein D3C86_1437360 [compost metagenome]